jgi:arachidonate 15-lipoxygenase (second type) / 8-lipoxygenase (S-type)
LKTLDDYNALYSDNNWQNTLPDGPFPGAITNYTQDLFFSMERLANAPYSVRRLSPTKDTLQIPIDDDTAREITGGSTLDELFHDGRLFYVDYRDQKDLEKTNVTGGACDAYFYINNAVDFMPLAIRTGVGNNLVYTPLDTPNDWLLAKILYSSNDFWFIQASETAR